MHPHVAERVDAVSIHALDSIFQFDMKRRDLPPSQQCISHQCRVRHDDDSPYIQVGDMMLLVRIVALVERGALVAEGDPWDMSSKVRLA